MLSEAVKSSTLGLLFTSSSATARTVGNLGTSGTAEQQFVDRNVDQDQYRR